MRFTAPSEVEENTGGRHSSYDHSHRFLFLGWFSAVASIAAFCYAVLLKVISQ